MLTLLFLPVPSQPPIHRRNPRSPLLVNPLPFSSRRDERMNDSVPGTLQKARLVGIMDGLQEGSPQRCLKSQHSDSIWGKVFELLQTGVLVLTCP